MLERNTSCVAVFRNRVFFIHAITVFIRLTATHLVSVFLPVQLTTLLIFIESTTTIIINGTRKRFHAVKISAIDMVWLAFSQKQPCTWKLYHCILQQRTHGLKRFSCVKTIKFDVSLTLFFDTDFDVLKMTRYLYLCCWQRRIWVFVDLLRCMIKVTHTPTIKKTHIIVDGTFFTFMSNFGDLRFSIFFSTHVKCEMGNAILGAELLHMFEIFWNFLLLSVHRTLLLI